MATATYDPTDIDFVEITSRCHDAMAQAGKVFVDAARVAHSRSAVNRAQFKLFGSLGGLVKASQEALDIFHDPQFMPIMEAAPAEVIDNLRELKSHIQQAKRSMAQLRSNDQIGRFWRHLYEPKVTRIEEICSSLDCHINTVMEGNVLLLSKNDERFLIDLLENPPSPTQAIRDLFSSK